MKKTMLIIFSLMSFQGIAMENMPYAGQENRTIKALSSSEIEGLKKGKGMGLAKAAELNHYPGPRHVLDEASKLSLTKVQLDKTNNLFNKMKQEAMMVGSSIIEAEQSLDNMFANGDLTSEQLKNKLNEIGGYRAQLRFIHLRTHLEQKKILSSNQVIHYDKLRGYTGKGGNHNQHNQHNGHH